MSINMTDIFADMGYSGGRSGLPSYFGDGSDGAFNPATILAGATAPNGGVVANLWDRNAGTVFTTGNLPAAADQVIFQIDFGTPELLPNSFSTHLSNFSISVGANRNLSWEWADVVGGPWTSISTNTAMTATTSANTNGATAAHRYWRLVLKAGGSDCTFSIQGVVLNYTTGDSPTSNVWRKVLPVTVHSGLVIKNFTSLTLPAGYTMTTDNPCRGLIVYVQGNVDISGSIDMSQKAGLAPNGQILPMLVTKKNASNVATVDKYYRLSTVLQSLIGGAGGNGGFGGGYLTGAANRSSGGTAGGGRQNLGGFGGGGGGGAFASISASYYRGGDGGNVDYSEIVSTGPTPSNDANPSGVNNAVSVTLAGLRGASGCGGSGCAYKNTTATVQVSSGPGGRFGGGGSGSAYSTTTATNSPGGTDGQMPGGFLCLIVGGNLTINSGGSLKADGGVGGTGGGAMADNSVGAANAGSSGGGGGGQGGGVVSAYYKGTFTNNGAITVNGGIGGAGGTKGGSPNAETGASGTSGSVGTILTQQIA